MAYGGKDNNGFLGGIHSLIGKQWGKTNKFFISLYPNGEMETEVLQPMTMDEPDFQAYIISTVLPDVANETIEEWVAKEYVYAPGRNSSAQFSIVFRDDVNNTLYKYFLEYSARARDKYYRDINWYINIDTISKKTSNENNSIRTHIISMEGIIDGISGITFDHSNDQIVEFSVNFKVKISV